MTRVWYVLALVAVLLVSLTSLATVAMTGGPSHKQEATEALSLADDTVIEYQKCVSTARKATRIADNAVDLATKWKERAEEAEQRLGYVPPLPQDTGQASAELP